MLWFAIAEHGAGMPRLSGPGADPAPGPEPRIDMRSYPHGLSVPPGPRADGSGAIPMYNPTAIASAVTPMGRLATWSQGRGQTETTMR
jgi:hypothetical protein